MSRDELPAGEIAEFDNKIEEARGILKETDGYISEMAKRLERLNELLTESPDDVFTLLDEIHLRIKQAYEKVSKSYEEAKKKYGELRNAGIALIEKRIEEIRAKKGELIHMGFKVDESIRDSVMPGMVLDLRQKEVLLFNDIEDCYGSAMLVTSKIKNMDSKANQLGYEYAEFSGKLYGLNNLLIVVSNTIGFMPGRKPAAPGKGQRIRPELKRGEQESEHYIR
jgi:DNA repair exonuclease SbcCD ATPase subunit